MDKLIREMHRLQEDVSQKMDYSEIWRWGNKISGGWGFWGSYELLNHSNPKEMVKAWVDALRDAGYEDIDIIFYGDWRDGRHIADNITPDMSYATFKAIVGKYAADPKTVAKENAKAYAEKIADIKRFLGIKEEEPAAISEKIEDEDDLEDRLDALEEAREDLLSAIDNVQEAVRNTGIEKNVDAYFIVPLKIMASEDHGYLSRDMNIDEIREMLEEEFGESEEDEDSGEPGEGGGLESKKASKGKKVNEGKIADEVNKYPEGILRDTAKAFADSFIADYGVKSAEREEANKLRNLHWTGQYTDADTFLKQAEIVGEYNEFTPEIAKKLVDRFGKDKKYRLAREGSVAVYVQGVDIEVTDQEYEEFKADEIDQAGGQNVLRLWWD